MVKVNQSDSQFSIGFPVRSIPYLVICLFSFIVFDCQLIDVLVTTTMATTLNAATSANAGNAGTAIPLAQAMAALPRDFESEKTRLDDLVRLLAGPLCDSPGAAQHSTGSETLHCHATVYR